MLTHRSSLPAIRCSPWPCSLTVHVAWQEDMSDQQRWHDLIRPKVSMLKFRLPWLPGDTEYLVGKVYTQPYAKPRSTEMRLIAEVRGSLS